MRIDSSFSVANVQNSSTEVVQDKSIEISKEVSIEDSSQENQGQKQFNENLLQKAMEQANKALEGANRKIERQVHEVTKAVMFKIVDTETDEVIKEFPPEKIQDMIAKMWELAGLFVDERA